MNQSNVVRQAAQAAALLLSMAFSPAGLANGPDQTPIAPPAWAVSAALPPAPTGVTDLRFADFFRRPVGPAGLEPSERLLGLAGRRVRIVGYMAAAALPMAGRLVLAPFPVELGDEDEHLADDLPPQAVFVHLAGPAANRTLPNFPGLLAVTGVLDLGARDEPDGHVSAVRLVLDAESSAAALPDAASAQR